MVSAPAAAPDKHQGTRSDETASDNLAWEQTYFLKRPFVQDAVQRWSKKSGEPVDRVLKSYRIQIMNFPDKVCVQLALKDFAVSGVPIYCYRVKGDRADADFVLIEEFSDVE